MRQRSPPRSTKPGDDTPIARNAGLAIALMVGIPLSPVLILMPALIDQMHSLHARFAAGPRIEATIKSVTAYRNRGNPQDSYEATVMFKNVVVGRPRDCEASISIPYRMRPADTLSIVPESGSCANVATAYERDPLSLF